MARRRRKGNPLLIRIILISVAVHIVVVPILAYYGAFRKIGIGPRRPVDIVMLAPPKHQAQPEVKKRPKQAHKEAMKGSGPKRPTASRATPLQQRVVAANTPAGANGTGPTVINPAKSAIAPGTLPPGPPTKPSPRPGGGGTGPVNTSPSPNTTRPTPPPITPTPTPALAPPKPHVPVVTEVATTYNPAPAIPDDLRGEAMDTNVSAEFLVSAEGLPENVKIVHSSGNDELDGLAVETAKKWRFKPATRDGKPIESRVVLHIEFEVQ